MYARHTYPFHRASDHAFGTRSFGQWQGEWYKNKFQGRGKYTWPSRAHYVGDWVDNKYARDRLVPCTLVPSLCRIHPLRY